MSFCIPMRGIFDSTLYGQSHQIYIIIIHYQFRSRIKITKNLQTVISPIFKSSSKWSFQILPNFNDFNWTCIVLNRVLFPNKYFINKLLKMLLLTLILLIWWWNERNSFSKMDLFGSESLCWKSNQLFSKVS